MFSSSKITFNARNSLRAALCAFLAFCAVGATSLHAQAPSNDNLSSAQDIIGSSGLVYGDNINATAELNEPPPYINPAQASIWYYWTAPISGTMDFNTRYSTDQNGLELGTVMAIYALTNSPLAFSNLSLLASNAFDPSAGTTNGDVTSRIDLPVKIGQVYLIQIDGSTNTPNGSNDQGWVELNWSPSLVSGGFGFSSATYFAGQFDDELLVDFPGNDLKASLHNAAGTNNIRITVTRDRGYTGKCELTLIVTNGVYTNYYATNYTGTNIFITNFSGTNVISPTNVINYTNIYYTNTAWVSEIANAINDTSSAVSDSAPDFTFTPFFGYEYLEITNANGFLTEGFNFSPSLLGLGLGSAGNPLNFFTNWPQLNETSETFTTNASSITVTWAQYFSTVVFTNYTTPSATSNDYVSTNIHLVFNDFQMSQDVYLQVNPTLGPDYPDASGNFTVLGINSLLTLTLTNLMLDSNEYPDILPPTITTSNAYLDVMNFYGIPLNAGTNNSSFNHATINLERATARANKPGVGGNATAYIWAVLNPLGGLPQGATYTCHYTVDSPVITADSIALPNQAFDDNGFTTVANSDYAQPAYYGVQDYDYGNPINNPPDPTGYGLGANTVFPAGPAFVGSFTIGPAGNGKPLEGEIAIPLYNPGGSEFDVDFNVQIYMTPDDAQTDTNEVVPAFLGNVTSMNVTINFSGIEPGGAYDVSFNPPGSPTASYPPNNSDPGANPPPLDGGVVNAVALQANGQAVIGGFFTSYNTTPVYSIARLLANGWLDTNFNNVTDGGVNGIVNSIAIDSQGRIIIGGNFSSYDGNLTPTPNIARLTANGTLDTTFKTGTGFNSTVYALSIDANSNILVGGDFTSYNTTNVNYICRLTTNGALDPSFFPNTANGNQNIGANQDVHAVATDSAGNIILGGDFTYVNGTNLNYLARLFPNGAIDTSFAPTTGPDDSVFSLAIEPNNEIVIGGAFQNYSSASSPGVALVTTSGALDTTFPIGTGADGNVYSVVLQPNGQVLVGGQFRNFNGTRRLGLARLLTDGWVDTSFMDTAYSQYAGLINTYYNQNEEPTHIANALAVQSDGNIIVGGSFTNIGGGTSRNAVNSQVNVTRLIGASTPGPMTGGGGDGNCPGNITLTQNPYTVNDTAGKLFVTLDRVNGSLGPAQVTLGTNTLSPGPGSATSKDFGLILPSLPLYNDIYAYWSIEPYGNYGWRVSDGYYGYNTAIQPGYSDFGDSSANINIFNDLVQGPDLLAGLSLVNITELGITSTGNTPPSAKPLYLGGVLIPTFPALGLPAAELEIINNNFPVGDIGFSSTNYTAINTSNSVTITVLRTNGNSGPISVTYFTANGTAIAGSNYTAIPLSQNKTLTFTGSGNDYTASFTVPILNNSTMQSSKFFKLYLTNASQTGVFDTNIPPVLSSTATVTIIDGNFQPGHLAFSSPTFSVLKPGQATISVVRLGSANGELTVQCGTSDGTGTNGINYVGVTNTLTWTNQDVSAKTITVQTLQDNTVEGTKTVNLSLFNATNIGSTGSASQILYFPSNAVLNILDSDSYGGLTFAAQNFNISQNAAQALITVVRTNGVTGTISANFTTLNNTNAQPPYQTALANTNYSPTNGLLTFGPGITSQNFVVPIIATPPPYPTGNRQVTLELFNGSPTNINGQFPVFATLTILDPSLELTTAGAVDVTTDTGTGFNGLVNSLALQPDGSILAGGAFTFYNQYPFNYAARLFSSGAFDSSFLFDESGPNETILQILSQPPSPSQTNGPVIIAGNFTSVDTVTRNGIARLDIDGSVDETFNPGSGADSTIFAVAPTYLPANAPGQPEALAYYIAGNFANFNGSPAGGIARLNAATNSLGIQGQLDPNFNVGQGVTSGSGAILALALQADGSVIAAGNFTSFNGGSYNHLVRLNAAGALDATFNPSTGTASSATVRAVLVQPDGRILIGGSFTNITDTAGSNYNLSYLARLNTNGTVDTNFTVGVGGNNTVMALALDAQQNILVGGEFSTFSGVTRNGITRLTPTGTVDPTINFGTGAPGGFVDTIVVQTNDEICLGGQFSTFEGLSENNFVRCYGGANYGVGQIQFSQTTYGILQNATNAIITLQRLGGEGTTTEPTVSVTFSTSDATAVNGIEYSNVTTNITFPLGETFENVAVPIINTVQVNSNSTTYLNLTLTAIAPAVLGANATAVLVITNVNSEVQYSSTSYRDSANVPTGSAHIPVLRMGNPNTTVAVTVYTGTNGSATPYTNYIPETNTLVFAPGVMTNYFNIPILNATNTFSDQTVDLEMTTPSNTIIGSPSSATLTIATTNTAPGVLAFSQTNYSVSEGATNAVITIIRTNGSSGSVAVTLTTSNGTAVSGVNYIAVQTTLNFADGETSQNVYIPLIQQPGAGPDTTVYMTLSNPQDGATIGGAATEILTILNDFENFYFASPFYSVSEGSNVIVSILRGGPSTNSATVSYSTYSPPNASETNGNAVPGVDYVAASGTLTFAPGVTNETVLLSTLQGTNVNGPLQYQVVLDDPLPNPPVEIGIPGETTITIHGDVMGFEFATNAYSVGENGSNVLVSVTCLNPGSGSASVQYGTMDGTAVKGVDYTATNGTLYFPSGVASNGFYVTILNPNLVESNKSFSVNLSNAVVLSTSTLSTNAYILSPSNATISITNVLTGVSFPSASFTVSECDPYATIPVIISGATNNQVIVSYSTANGSGIAGTNYIATQGSLIFQPGETVTNFQVPIINNHIIGPDRTVFLTLSNAQGAQLLNPSTAVLTIQECNGAYIVKSGTAFVNGTISPASGVIFPNDTVTVLFGLRDVAGSNTVNLVATLLATNGVTNVSGSQDYGVLITNGPTVSRPFTFTAIGTNGQNIAATFTLQDGSAVYSNVVFGFTLGGGSQVYSTNETLYLKGTTNVPSKAYNSNAPNFGYPSLINVSGVVGEITAVTATINDFGHSAPSDVAMVLESPAGQATYLMAYCGGFTSVNNLTLTFSPFATQSLPESSALMSGTYLPTAYGSPPMPSNGLGQPSPPLPPYAVSLTNFVGTSPNGNWALYVADENTLDSGYLSNGWSLTINTGLGVEEDSDLEMTMTTTPSVVTLSNAFTYNVVVTNFGPAGATNVVITDTLPAGVAYLGSTTVNCTVATNNLTNGILTYTAASLAVGGGATFSIQLMPTNGLVYLTNIASALANEPDPNSNNVQTNITQVGLPSAQLAVILNDSPNPVVNGGYVTYTITVTNSGPSASTGIEVFDTLPVGFTPSPVPAHTLLTTNNSMIMVTWTNLFSLADGVSTNLSLVAAVNVPAGSVPSSTNIDSVFITSQVFQPTKLTDFASVKTEVVPDPPSAINTGTNYMLVWPQMPGTTALQGTVSLPPTWVTLTNTVVAQPILGIASSTVMVPYTNTYHFFRLKSMVP